MTDAEKSEHVSQYNYLIIQCHSCGQLLIAKNGQKNKLCIYCNIRLSVPRAKVIAETPTSRAASEIVKILKKNQIPALENSNFRVKEPVI